MSFDVLLLILPIFAMIGIGTLFVWRGWFQAEGLPHLNRFVLNACIPVLLFSAIASGGSLADFAWTSAGLYAAASLGSALACMALLIAMGATLAEAAILALGASIANSIFLGFPIASRVIPEDAVTVVSWVVLAEIAVVIPTLTTLAALADRREGRARLAQVARSLVLNPISLGLIAGFAFLLVGVALPAWMAQVVDTITAAAPFIALFLIGGSLLQVQVTEAGPRVLVIAVAKVVLHPALVALVFGVALGWGSVELRHATLFAAMPPFLTYVVLAGRHGVSEVAASTVVLATLFGAVTVTLVLQVLT